MAGGVLFNLLAIRYSFHIKAPISWIIVLPLATWLVYLTDHIVDVLRVKKDFPTPRHRFIKDHLKSIIALAALISGAIAYFSMVYYHTSLIYCGLIMAGITGIHLLIARMNPQSKNVLNNKELGVSFIYATAIYIYPLYVSLQLPTIDTLFYFYALFLLLTYQNLLLCSIIEYHIDVQMNNTSLIRSTGLAIGKQIFFGVSLSALLLVVIILFSFNLYNPKLLGMYFLILAGHYLIYLKREKLRPYLLYRKIAELLFWLPLLSLL